MIIPPLRWITAIWPFLLEMVLGEKMTTFQAYRDKPRQFLTAVMFALTLLLMLVSWYRLYYVSKEQVVVEKRIHHVERHYQALVRDYNVLAQPYGFASRASQVPVEPPTERAIVVSAATAPPAVPSSTPTSNRHDYIRDHLSD